MTKIVPSWTKYFMNLLGPISSRSKDPNTQVGALATTASECIVATGYNSFPRGINDNAPERLERPEKYNWMVHAEANVIYSAARTVLEGCTIYTNMIPCMPCALGIIQSGIKKVVYDKKRVESDLKCVPDGENWRQHEKVKRLFWEAGIILEGWEDAEG